jgi:putative transposase
MASLKIVGWSMSDHHDAEFAEAALSMALLQRQPGADLIHHSDRGSEYASTSYQMMLSEHGIQGSMSKKGDCYDNAMIESFWATLFLECVEERHFSSRKEAKNTIFAYISIYYNRIRRHSSLGYMSPVEYEKQGEQKKEQKKGKA